MVAEPPDFVTAGLGPGIHEPFRARSAVDQDRRARDDHKN